MKRINSATEHVQISILAYIYIYIFLNLTNNHIHTKMQNAVEVSLFVGIITKRNAFIAFPWPGDTIHKNQGKKQI